MQYNLNPGLLFPYDQKVIINKHFALEERMRPEAYPSSFHSSNNTHISGLIGTCGYRLLSVLQRHT